MFKFKGLRPTIWGIASKTTKYDQHIVHIKFTHYFISLVLSWWHCLIKERQWLLLWIPFTLILTSITLNNEVIPAKNSRFTRRYDVVLHADMTSFCTQIWRRFTRRYDVVLHADMTSILRIILDIVRLYSKCCLLSFSCLQMKMFIFLVDYNS